MNELIDIARRLLTLVPSGWPLELGETEAAATREPEQTLPHGRLGNGVRWADIVADIESEGVSVSDR